MTESKKRNEKMEAAIATLLQELGEDPGREGLQKTPTRVVNSLSFLTKGYSEDPHKIINDAIFHETVDEMIVVKDIEIYSLCEHHMLPFVGKAHVAYIPNGKIVGLSKVARLVDIYARRFQVQERLTNQIASIIQEVLTPRGVAVVIEAEHMCMRMRGVQKQNSVMLTSSMLGDFKNNLATRTEFMTFLKLGK